MDARGNIYRASKDEVPLEDMARLDGYFMALQDREDLLEDLLLERAGLLKGLLQDRKDLLKNLVDETQREDELTRIARRRAKTAAHRQALAEEIRRRNRRGL